MAQVKLSLASIMAILVVAGHAVLLAILYYTLGAVVRDSHERQFVQKVRTFSRLIAEQLESGRVADSPRLEVGLLDTVILDGDGVYAQLEGAGVHLRSELGSPGIAFPSSEDFALGQHGDAVYFVRVPVVQGGRTLELRLGFDESSTVAAVKDARRRLFWTLCAYLGLSTGAALLLGYAMAQPVRKLQAEARQVAALGHAGTLRLRTPISELHDLAADLEHMRNTLVGTNQELRREMAQKEQLEGQRARLEQQLRHRQRVETVGTLAGGIAHEFNNVLVPITLLSELVLKRLSPGHESRADLTTIRDAAQRARELTGQILAFSRDLGALALEPVDVREVVDEALKLLRPLVSPNVRLQTQLVGESCRVLADRGLLLQLLMNLCKNACQSIAAGEGAVTIGVRHVDGRQGGHEGAGTARTLELSVRDTGAGIEPEVAARIFEPFFSTRAVGEGTGLGLSVVQGIVDSLGARIEVSSEPGAGSVFTVLFRALD